LDWQCKIERFEKGITKNQASNAAEYHKILMKPTCFPVPSIHEAGSISFNKLQVNTTLLIF
jgi:hypothetical protein